MARPPSLDKATLDSLTSGKPRHIASGLKQAQALGWDVPQVLHVLTEFLDPLVEAGYLVLLR
jgi:hypothetical protein